MARPRHKIDPRELIPATRPKQPFERFPIPAAPIIGNTELVIAAPVPAFPAAIPVNFILPTTRVKPRGIIYVYDMTFEHQTAAVNLIGHAIERQAPEDATPWTVYNHHQLPGVAMPLVVTFGTPLPFPFGADAIYQYTPSLRVAFSGAGGALDRAFINLNWVFYELTAAQAGGLPVFALGDAAARAGSYKRYEVSE